MSTYYANIGRVIGACLWMCAPAAAGCGADTEPTPEQFEVSSAPQAGRLARIDYVDGGYVEFLESDEGGTFIGAAFDKTGFDPVQGIQLSSVLPSELFTYLTSREAPAAIVAAEREAGLMSYPQAFAGRGDSGEADDLAQDGADDVGTASSALTATDFSALYCYPGIHFCSLGISGDLRINSDGRVDAADGHVDVLSGSVRVRIYRKRIVGGNHLLATYMVPAGTLLSIGAATPGIDRKMWVVVDLADNATYNLAVHFRD